MTILASIVSNCPVSPTYVDLIPDGTQFPYAVITSLGGGPTYSVGDSYFDTFNFQVTIYHSSLASAESVAATVDSAYNRQFFAANCMGCNRTSYMILPVETAFKVVSYAVALEYESLWNRSVQFG